MTKDEIRAKIAEITKENTTEVLHAEVLNALVDMIPGGTLIDLSSVTISGETDVTSYIPEGYIPKIGDEIKVMSNTQVVNTFLMSGVAFYGDYKIWDAVAGYTYGSDSSAYQIHLQTYDNKVIANIFEL